VGSDGVPRNALADPALPDRRYETGPPASVVSCRKLRGLWMGTKLPERDTSPKVVIRVTGQLD